MKISKTNPKKSIKASSQQTKENIQACDDADAIVLIQEEAAADPTCCCKYERSLELISAAIESLAEIAKDDQIAKDSIANLGVVMLDLKSNC